MAKHRERSATSPQLMDTLLRHEYLPQPLGAWLARELECGVGSDERVLLVIALEGLLGIPPAHRVAPQRVAPGIAALKLANDMLAGNTRQWTIQQVNTYTARLAKTQGIDGYLRAWCTLRMTHRALERAAQAARQLQFADGRPVVISSLPSKSNPTT